MAERFRIVVASHGKQVLQLYCHCEARAFELYQQEHPTVSAGSTLEAMGEMWFGLPFETRLDYIARASDELDAGGMSDAQMWTRLW